MSPEIATQMQKTVDRKGMMPMPSGGHTPQPQVPPQNNQPMNPRIPVLWQGILGWNMPHMNGQGLVQMHTQVVCTPTPQTSGDVHANTWPTNLQLKFSPEPLGNNTELRNWVERHRPPLVQFSPRPNDVALNTQTFGLLIKWMADRRIYAFTGWTLRNGNMADTMLMFPSQNVIRAAVFPVTGLPDFPGSRNLSDHMKLLMELLENRGIDGLNLPPQVVNRLQNLSREHQAQAIMQYHHFAQQQRQASQLRRPEQQPQQPHPQPQQQQQQQQLHPMQNMNMQGFGQSNMVAMPPRDPHMNYGVNLVGMRPGSVGIQNGNGRTVNMEMFMQQRNAGGPPSQGMNPS